MSGEPGNPRPSHQALEIDLFLQALKQRHGYDFTAYSAASMKRRVVDLAVAAGCATISDLIPRIIHEDGFLSFAVSHLAVSVSEMFRDPKVYLALRQSVVPVLATYPRINAWVAGCASGEEVYSLAILLAEEGLYDRTQIYATDINDHALAKAEEGVYSTKGMDTFRRNYAQGGGKRNFDDYFLTRYEFSKIDSALKKNILFAHHNLVGDGVFCEMNMVLFRNVLIYFSRELQDQALRLIDESLVRGGFLCIGTKESLRFSGVAEEFSIEAREENIYRKHMVLDR